MVWLNGFGKIENYEVSNGCIHTTSYFRIWQLTFRNSVVLGAAGILTCFLKLSIIDRRVCDVSGTNLSLILGFEESVPRSEEKRSNGISVFVSSRKQNPRKVVFSACTHSVSSTCVPRKYAKHRYFSYGLLTVCCERRRYRYPNINTFFTDWQRMDILHSALAAIQSRLSWVSVVPVNWKFYVQSFSWGVCIFESYLLCVTCHCHNLYDLRLILAGDNTHCTLRRSLQRLLPAISLVILFRNHRSMARTKQNFHSCRVYIAKSLTLRWSIMGFTLSGGN